MKLVTISNLHPDLVITTEAAIDRMSIVANESAEKRKPYFDKQIQLIRRQARMLCGAYKNCREENWCFFCSSGQTGVFYRGDTCLGCKLLTGDALLKHKSELAIVPYIDKSNS